jgi:hypothetical protein
METYRLQAMCVISLSIISSKDIRTKAKRKRLPYLESCEGIWQHDLTRYMCGGFNTDWVGGEGEGGEQPLVSWAILPQCSAIRLSSLHTHVLQVTKPKPAAAHRTMTTQLQTRAAVSLVAKTNYYWFGQFNQASSIPWDTAILHFL